ncbi:MAG: hypothetical protein ABT05_05690 [Lautropia sp. SCN 66-9]|nr:MAG: hypothetical protein ABT05_05690 [Lautropia sp. SCN 66-9]
MAFDATVRVAALVVGRAGAAAVRVVTGLAPADFTAAFAAGLVAVFEESLEDTFADTFLNSVLDAGSDLRLGARPPAGRSVRVTAAERAGTDTADRLLLPFVAATAEAFARPALATPDSFPPARPRAADFKAGTASAGPLLERRPCAGPAAALSTPDAVLGAALGAPSAVFPETRLATRLPATRLPARLGTSFSDRPFDCLPVVCATLASLVDSPDRAALPASSCRI